MKYIWDDNKNKINIEKHKIDFNDSIGMFNYPLLACIDQSKNYEEERWIGIGFLKGIIAVIVYTEDDEKEIIRIISCRRATKNENKRFKKSLGY